MASLQHRAAFGAHGRRANAPQGQCSRSRVVAMQAGQNNKSLEDMLKEASALLEKVETRSQSAQPLMSATSSMEELEELGYVCDESGCVLLPGMLDIDESGSPLKRLLHGSNWKLGLDMEPTNADFTAVVAGPYWTVPMTNAELATFLEVFQRVRSVVASLQSEAQWTPGSAERPLSRVRWESGRIHMQATYALANGTPCFALDFTLQTLQGRPVGVCWPPEIVAAVSEALDRELGPLPVATPSAAAAAANVAA